MRSISFLLLALFIEAAFCQGQSTAPSAAADEFLRSGIAAQQQGNLKAAIDDYRKALALVPQLAEARANLGVALAADGQLDAAIDEDNRALAAAPRQTSLRMNLALAYYKKGDWPHAFTEFQAVHAARPADLSATMLLGYSEIKLDKAAEAARMLLPLEPGHETNMDFEYVLAYALIQSGKEADGLPRMEKSAKATNSLDSWIIAGTARLHRREFKEARTDLDAALQIAPDFPGLNTMAGQARDALSDTAAAQPAFEAALRQDPKDFIANLYLGTMLLKQRNLDGARPLLELALQLQPNMPQARLQMAKLNSLTGKYAEAAATLEELEKADPNWLEPHVELAAIYYKLHRTDDGQRERDIVQKIEAQQQKTGPPPK